MNNGSDSIILTIDLGANSIKYLLWEDDIILMDGLIVHDTIHNGQIVNYIKLYELFFKLIYELEVEFLISVHNIMICIDFPELFIDYYEKTIEINDIVNENHLRELQNKNHNTMYLLDYINEHYIINGSHEVKNPLCMQCQTLKYSVNHIYMQNFVINHIKMIFQKLNLNILKICSGFMTLVNNITQSEYVLLDLGKDNSRFVKKIHGNIEFGSYFNGLDSLTKTLGNINLIDKYHGEKVALFFSNFSTENVCSFVTGAATYIPLLNEFLRQKLYWNINTLNIHRISSQYNSDLFMKCYFLWHNYYNK